MKLIKTIFGLGAIIGLLWFGFKPAKRIYDWTYAKLGGKYTVEVKKEKYFLKDVKTGQEAQISDGLYVGNADHMFKGLVKFTNENPDSNEELFRKMQDYSNKKILEMNKDVPIAKGFENPYNLSIMTKADSTGNKGYLINRATNDTLPIYKGVHVGDLKHRCRGLFSYLKEILNFEEVKK